MTLFDRGQQKHIRVEIEQITSTELEKINQSDQFQFDWLAEKYRDSYKLSRVSSKEVLGLISLEDFADEHRIHIHLLESSKANISKGKTIDGIAGCFIAFAAKLAFKKGYYGFISLISKTELIEHYVKYYGFSHHNRILYLQGKTALNLIQKYHQHEI